MNKLLSEEFLSLYKNRRPPWGFGLLGEFVYYRTYSRKIDNLYQCPKCNIITLPEAEGHDFFDCPTCGQKAVAVKEQWWQTIERCIEGAQKIGAKYTVDEAQRLFDYIFNLKCCFAGRMLWQLGTKTVDLIGGTSLLNCFYLSMRDIGDFSYLFELLMLGCGVGFSVRNSDIYELPRVKKGVNVVHECTKDADFIVPDKREGWANLLDKTMRSYLIDGKGFTYSTIVIRGKGEPIRTFGGTASGPGILVDGITQICSILDKRAGKKLRPIDVLDICCIIADVVVSGNVRRSSSLSLGDPDNVVYLKAKRWDLGDVPPWRSNVNCSIDVDSTTKLLDRFWDGYRGNGEPYGLINMQLAQSHGRLIDGPMKNSNIYPTKFDPCEGVNPCGETTLEPYAACLLSELNLSKIESLDEMIDCATLLYKAQKAVCRLPFINEKTEKAMHDNARIGLSITGICQSMDKLDWLDPCYKALRDVDKQWSKQNGWPESIKLTTLQPSGTKSFLFGTSPGIHPMFAKWFIRRVRIASDSALLEICKAAKLPIEYVERYDGTKDYRTSIVSFPCKAHSDCLFAGDMTAIDQLELVKKIQTIWSDQSVSCTVYYTLEELDSVKCWLEENYEKNIKSVSFLLKKDHGFKQAPFEEITEEEYNRMIKSLRLDKFKLQGAIDITDEEYNEFECTNGSCPVK